MLVYRGSMCQNVFDHHILVCACGHKWPKLDAKDCEE